MSINIYRHEFLARLKSVIIWSVAMAFIIIFFFSLFPAFSDQAATMNEFLARYPAQLRAAFGLDKIDLSTVLGFFSFTLVFVELCMAIQAGNYGFGLVSVEETELTADFLLSKPVSRPRVLTSKLLAAFTGLLITELVVWVCTFTSMQLFRSGHDYSTRTLLLLLFSLLIFQLVFFGIGLLISLLVRRVRSVTPYGLGLAFGAYVINGFSGVFGTVELELLTPFKHLDPSTIVLHASYDAPLVLIDVVVILVTIGVSYWLYTRRDIPAVS
jgi:beta-exotoxin I transport system permease protein